MAEYLIKEETLVSIADAIREKSDITNIISPKDIPIYIRNITTTSDNGDIPDDIVAEAKRVANAMIPKIANNSITFIAMSDMHEMGDNDYTGTDVGLLERYRRANRNAGQGAKIISNLVPIDFFANLGDFAWGNKEATVRRDTISSIIRAKSYTFDVHDSMESFFAQGNHDARYYGGYLDAELAECLTGNYRYVDFESKKVRVICVNTADTSDGTESAERISGEQLQWFAESLDLSKKSDVANWKIIVLSHHPMDWGDVKPLANCLAAYLNGTNYTTSHDGVNVSYNFSGKNVAKFIANFHGHVHCFKIANISGTSVKRIAIPNACYGRNNEYGQLGNTEFGETITYDKTDNFTGKNTSFCLVSIDLDEGTIYADCFGAGYDRVIGCGTHTITSTLTNAINHNSITSVEDGSPYIAYFNPYKGYDISSISVTMNGIDVTNSVVIGNVVRISSVTGDVNINVATTVDSFNYGEFTNLVRLSEERGSTSVYNDGVGYKNGVYASEAGDKTDAAIVSTGWIPYSWSLDNSLYIKGALLDTSNNHVRIYGFNSKTTMNDNVGYASGSRINERFTVEQLGDKYYKLTPVVTDNNVNYIRVSLVGTGVKLVVTVNEPIHSENGETITYTNLVPTMQAVDSTAPYNGTGYKNGVYSSTSAAPYEGTDAECVTTGLMPYGTGVTTPLYIKGATINTTKSHCRIQGFGSNKKPSIMAAVGGELNTYFSIETLGDQYYKVTPKTAWTDTAQNGGFADYLRFSLIGTGDNLIITLNEPIE